MSFRTSRQGAAIVAKKR